MFNDNDLATAALQVFENALKVEKRIKRGSGGRPTQYFHLFQRCLYNRSTKQYDQEKGFLLLTTFHLSSATACNRKIFFLLRSGKKLIVTDSSVLLSSLPLNT